MSWGQEEVSAPTRAAQGISELSLHFRGATSRKLQARLREPCSLPDQDQKIRDHDFGHIWLQKCQPQRNMMCSQTNHTIKQL